MVFNGGGLGEGGGGRWVLVVFCFQIVVVCVIFCCFWSGVRDGTVWLCDCFEVLNKVVFVF